VEQQTVRKAFKYKLKLTAEQKRMLDRALMLCRHVYNAAVGERREAWQMCGISIGYYQQKAKLPPIKAEMPECSEVQSQVFQEVVQRVDRAFQACFRRVKAGETPGYPRFHGRDRFNSLTYPQFGNGPRSTMGTSSSPKPGRIAVRWSCPLEGRPKTVTIRREGDAWYACFSCADVPIQSLSTTGQETGIDLGLEAFATRADVTRILNPGWYRRAEHRLKTT
jgi:putative transposase